MVVSLWWLLWLLWFFVVMVMIYFYIYVRDFCMVVQLYICGILILYSLFKLHKFINLFIIKTIIKTICIIKTIYCYYNYNKIKN